jgi:hypothetical protein
VDAGPRARVSGVGGATSARRVASAARRAAGPRAAAVAASRAGAISLPLRPLPGRDRAAKPAGGLGQRIGSFVASLPDHPWLDRVVRGRAWIPLLGVLLAGIIAAQVEILKLGATMGRALEQTTTLTTQNEQLRGSVAALADDQRIERLAAGMGLVLPPPGAVGYLAAQPGGNASGALANIHSPNPSAFVWLTPKNGALVTGPGASTLPPGSGVLAPATVPGTSTATGTGAGSATGAGTASTPGASAGTATGTASGSQGATSPQGSTTPSQATATTSQAPATTSQGATTNSQAPAGGATPTQQGTSTSGGQGLATGAASIQPASSGQASAGG